LFLLLDEPFAGVDPIAVSEIQSMIAQLCDRKIGILITDHNVTATLRITDRNYILIDGQIIARGSASEITQDENVKKFYLGQQFRSDEFAAVHGEGEGSD
jgi:lipopolysaccharide export system ATP-binding protein